MLLSEADELALDRHEGYPAFYYKAEMVLPITGIRTGKVRERKIFVYIMDESRKIGVPTMRYFQTCAEGYSDFGFDRRILVKAYYDSMEDAYENGSK